MGLSGKEKRTIPFCVSYWGVKGTGHCLLSGMQNLGAEMCLTLAAEMCVVSECGGCKAAPPGNPPEFDTCLLSEGKQRQSHYNFDVTRYSSIHLHLWHLETPLGSSPAFSFVLNYLMVRIGKHHPGKAQMERRGVVLFLFLPLATSLMNLRIVGF